MSSMNIQKNDDERSRINFDINDIYKSQDFLKEFSSSINGKKFLNNSDKKR